MKQIRPRHHPRGRILCVGLATLGLAAGAWRVWIGDGRRAPDPLAAFTHPADDTAHAPQTSPARHTPPAPSTLPTSPAPVVPTASSAHESPFVEALRAAERLSADADREAARTNTLSTWAETDPRAAFLHVWAPVLSEADAYVCANLFHQWANLDFMAAIEFAERQPAGKSREDLLGRLALVVARFNPAEAAMIAEHDMTPGPIRTETAISVLHQWASQDTAGATAWAAAFPPGAFRERALNEISGFAPQAATRASDR